jgi:hypothetical protein
MARVTKQKSPIPPRRKAPRQPERNVGLRLIPHSLAEADVTRMSLEQLDRALSAPESIAQVKNIVRELVRREKAATASDPRSSFPLEFFKLKARRVVEEITMGKLKPTPRQQQSFVVPKGLLEPARSLKRPSNEGDSKRKQPQSAEQAAADAAAKSALKAARRAEQANAILRKREARNKQNQAKALAKQRLPSGLDVQLIRKRAAEAPRLSRPSPAKPAPPTKPAYIAEYEAMMGRFRQLAKLVMMPAPSAAAQESRARSQDAMRKLEAEFDAWQKKYPPQQFPWPKLAGGAGTGSMDFAMADQSPLSVLGYRVGKTSGLSEDERRCILDYAFANRLPPIESPAYMAEWGPPRTPDRLRRIAEHLAQTFKMFRSKSPTVYSVALGQWRDDLVYLRRTYYERKFGWIWPS